MLSDEVDVFKFIHIIFRLTGRYPDRRAAHLEQNQDFQHVGNIWGNITSEMLSFLDILLQRSNILSSLYLLPVISHSRSLRQRLYLAPTDQTSPSQLDSPGLACDTVDEWHYWLSDAGCQRQMRANPTNQRARRPCRPRGGWKGGSE